ncbi:MAG: hypothetical protein IT381_09910 [Deltaproteobacteria bacterium]|nr:hypothetical protein [Deltaproteobacteria bacterium]
MQPYRSPHEREARLDTLARAAGADTAVIGESVDGAPIRAARIANAGAPKVLCCANIHGPEYVGAEVALGLLERLAAPEGEIAKLRERAEIWIVPCVNPDGYRRTWDREGKGTLAALRTNARGVDLNRNFPLPGGALRRSAPGAGSQRHGDATYCGPAPLSEPETRAIAELAATQRFHASANLHSFMGTLIPARVTDRDAYSTYRDLCRAFVSAQSHTRYHRVASRVFDVFTGEQEDHLHHALACWSICVETFPVAASLRQHLRAPSLFWRFNPRDPARWIENDVPGLVRYFLTALDLRAPPLPAPA